MFGYAKEKIEENIKELSENQKRKDSEIKVYEKRLGHINLFYQLKDKVAENRNLALLETISGLAIVLGSLSPVLSSVSVVISLLGWISVYGGIKNFYDMKNNKRKLVIDYSDLSNMSLEEVKILKEEYVIEKEKCCLDNYKIQSKILEYSKVLTKIAEYSDILEDTKKDIPLYLADTKEEYEMLSLGEASKTEEEKLDNLTETSKEFIKRFPKM